LARFCENSGHYENDNCAIKKFDELLAFARVPARSVRSRLLLRFRRTCERLAKKAALRTPTPFSVMMLF